MEEEETEEGDGENGNRGPPGTRWCFSLSKQHTDGEAPWWAARGGALCTSLVPRLPRQATGATPGDAPKVCIAYLVLLSQDATVREGR